MKRLLIAATILFVATGAFADDVWTSSNTATADVTKRLCPQAQNTTKMGHGVFHGACVNYGVSLLTGTLQVFNSSAAAVNPIALVDAGLKGCSYYDIAFSSGFSYTSVSTANVTMMYSCW